jgi:hypothetical protein
MDEQVLTTLIGSDEPIALLITEPLDRASCHKNTSLHALTNG